MSGPRRWWSRQSRSPSVGELLQTAVRALIDDDDETAEVALAEWVRRDSSRSEAYRALGRLYRKRGEVGRAIRLHQNLLLRTDLGSREREAALSELANDFEVGGFRKRAIACHEELLAVNARREESLAALVELLGQEGERERALVMHRRLEKARKIRDPEGEAALLVADASARHQAGDADAARRLLKKSLRRNPDQVAARLLMGDLDAERGRGRAAIAMWREAAERGGEEAAPAWARLAASFGARGREGAFERLLRGRLEAEPGDVEARRQLASALVADGQIDQALAALRTLLEGEPRDQAARIAIGKLLLAERRNSEALKEFGELLAMLENENGQEPSA